MHNADLNKHAAARREVPGCSADVGAHIWANTCNHRGSCLFYGLLSLGDLQLTLHRVNTAQGQHGVFIAFASHPCYTGVFGVGNAIGCEGAATGSLGSQVW